MKIVSRLHGPSLNLREGQHERKKNLMNNIEFLKDSQVEAEDATYDECYNYIA